MTRALVAMVVLASMLGGRGVVASPDAQAAAPGVPLKPVSTGRWWPVAGDPDLGPLTSPKQQPVDFAIWQAADGTWQLWSCIRGTQEPARRDSSIVGKARDSPTAIGRPRASRCRRTRPWARRKAACRHPTSSATTASTGCSTATGRTSAWPPARTGRPSRATAIPRAGRSSISRTRLTATATDATRWCCLAAVGGTAITRHTQEQGLRLRAHLRRLDQLERTSASSPRAAKPAMDRTRPSVRLSSNRNPVTTIFFALRLTEGMPRRASITPVTRSTSASTPTPSTTSRPCPSQRRRFSGTKVSGIWPRCCRV